MPVTSRLVFLFVKHLFRQWINCWMIVFDHWLSIIFKKSDHFKQKTSITSSVTIDDSKTTKSFEFGQFKKTLKISSKPVLPGGTEFRTLVRNFVMVRIWYGIPYTYGISKIVVRNQKMVRNFTFLVRNSVPKFYLNKKKVLWSSEWTGINYIRKICV